MENKNQTNSESNDSRQEASKQPVTIAQKNIQIVRDFFLAMDTPGTESEEILRNILDKDISWHAVPWNRTFSGREEVLSIMRKMWESSIPSHPISYIFADEEWVCIEYVLSSTKKSGKMMFHDSSVPEGKLNVPAVSIYHVKDGKIDIAREYIDRLTEFQQLGVDHQSAVPPKKA